MKEIIFIDPETFEEIKQEFDDFHYAIAEEIQEALSGKKICDNCLHFSYTTKIVTNFDGDKLFIGIMKDRKTAEEVAEKYKITIEKINP